MGEAKIRKMLGTNKKPNGRNVNSSTSKKGYGDNKNNNPLKYQMIMSVNERIW